MPSLVPFLVHPEFHERVWGTRDLRPYFTHTVEGEPIGEVWLTGDTCQVSGGPLAGKTLAEVSSAYGAEFVGAASAQPNRFPLLIKFLFPRQKLSVQVHPDDARAHEIGEPCGKTECWYVARSVAGAQVGLGLRPGIDVEMFRMAIEQKQAEHMLNWLDVAAGQMIYVDAGTVHAMGPNAIFIETQQNSDLTYRLYDYGRPRQLHLEQGLACLRARTHAGLVPPRRVEEHDLLLAAPRFVVEQYAIQEPVTLHATPGASSVQVLVALEGGAVVESPGAPAVTMMRGDAAIIPACVAEFTVRPQWSADVLRMYVPGEATPEPQGELRTCPADAGSRR
ncbi:MAG: class I mannose-6-phosphate isomerase [Acidobacteriota bacterium]|nr:class I mannose-6-phosphate isomerase [Acidobacteriota bacterium]